MSSIDTIFDNYYLSHGMTPVLMKAMSEYSALKQPSAATTAGAVDPPDDTAQRTGSSVVPQQLDIRILVDEYFQFRGYEDPDANQALLFLVSEVGELCNAFVHGQAQWVRNHPEDKNGDVAGEVADVLMMLTKFAEKVGIDPVLVMLSKFEKKGFHCKAVDLISELRAQIAEKDRLIMAYGLHDASRLQDKEFEIQRLKEELISLTGSAATPRSNRQ